MTKRDYRAIARAIHEAHRGHVPVMIPANFLPGEWRLVEAIADVLAVDNPRFRRDLFVEACETGRCKGMPR